MKASADQIKEYNTLRATKGQSDADAFAAQIIAAMSLETPLERGNQWKLFKAEINAEKESVEKAKKAAKKAAKAEMVSISKVCKSLLEKNITAREAKFLTSIKSKRKLSVKQEKWFRDIAKNHNVDASGKINNSKAAPQSTRYVQCDHGDLGSMGYTHGSKVVCPDCGCLAEVW